MPVQRALYDFETINLHMINMDIFNDVYFLELSKLNRRKTRLAYSICCNTFDNTMSFHWSDVDRAGIIIVIIIECFLNSLTFCYLVEKSIVFGCYCEAFCMILHLV